MGRFKKDLLKYMKRGMSSLFVFSMVVFPIVSTVMWAGQFRAPKVNDPRQTTVLPALTYRPQDLAGALLPFWEPIVTVTFDDGWESVYTEAAPLLQKYGIRTTQYVLSSVANNFSYMSISQLTALHDAGHEIACHGTTHDDLTTLPDDQLVTHLSGCQTFYGAKFGSVQDFASPYSAENSRTLDAIKAQYRSQRNTFGDITNGMSEFDVNLKATFKPYDIISFAIRGDTTVKQINDAITYTIANNGWLVLTYHELESSSSFSLDSSSFEAQLAAISKQNVRIAPLGDVVNALTPTNNPMRY